MNKKLLSGRFVWLLLVLVGAGLQADLVLAQTGKSRAAKSRGRAALLPPADGKASAQAKEGEGGDANRIVREGLVVDFNVTPAVRRATGSRELMEGEHVEVSFRITDAANGQPVSGLYPAAWIDISKPWGSEQTAGVNCKDRVALYLQGSVGFRPMVDLNSYFVLVMNRDATISVIDPLVGITGITQLYP